MTTTDNGHRRPRPHVMIMGGGVAGLEALLALRHLAEDRVEIELVSPSRDFVYRPLSVGEPFGLNKVWRFDIGAIAASRGVAYRPEPVAGIDASAQTVITAEGEELGYDALVIALGARMCETLPGALTFWGTADPKPFRRLLADIESGEAREIVFALPAGAGWPLPLYELALLTARHLKQHAIDGVNLTVATHEDMPLGMFGQRAASRVEELLDQRGIGLLTGAHPSRLAEGRLHLVPGGQFVTDRVVTVPRLEGPYLEGVPQDEHGFIPVDEHGAVRGLDDVYAAGDATNFPVKQGGLAAQQADAVAAAIAKWAGAPVDAAPFDPVLRGLLMTGDRPSFMRARLRGGQGDTTALGEDALWWPPGKIAGRYLAPYLAAYARTELRPAPPDGGEHVEAKLV